MSITQLYQLATVSDSAISGRAQLALQLTESANRGDISADEYQELCRDLSRIDTLDRESANLELKTALVTAVWAVAQLR